MKRTTTKTPDEKHQKLSMSELLGYDSDDYRMDNAVKAIQEANDRKRATDKLRNKGRLAANNDEQQDLDEDKQ